MSRRVRAWVVVALLLFAQCGDEEAIGGSGMIEADQVLVSAQAAGQVMQLFVDEAEFTPKNVRTEESRAGLMYAVKVSIPNPGRTLKVGMAVYVTLEAR